MQAAQVLAGYTLGGADLLRRAMGKKDKEKMAKEREKFVDGAVKLHDIHPDKANDIFDLLDKFAGYGFNRSHSAAYAWISYQTAFLKANYPVEFMAAVMSNEISNTDKISIFVGECERLGIRILAPDVNKSGLKFSPEDVSEEGIAAAKAARRAKAADAETEAPIEEQNVRFEELPAAAEHRTSNIERACDAHSHRFDPLRPRGDQERRRDRDGSRDRGSRERRRIQVAGRFLRARRFKENREKGHRMPREMRRIRLPRRGAGAVAFRDRRRDGDRKSVV